MKKTAIEFVKDFIRKEDKDFLENEGFERAFEEFIAWESMYSEDNGDSRWWTNTFCVAKIEDVLIGYNWASTTGDDTIFDKGWTFDESSICYVEKEEVLITKYVKCKEQ